jgi:hypothetical protein
MKFALIDGNKTEATKGAKGLCPSCGSELIAKCGEVKINHWAHKSIRSCDPWWESETEWHRSWKNNFPDDWQEIALPDVQTGEKHIADVRTIHGLVIEFQHSHIDPKELTSRENFYKKMVWVVDGTRLKRDYPRFLKEKNDLRKTNKQGIFLVDFPDECFPTTWLGSSVPVLFDFRGTNLIDDPKDIRNNLYCLFPKRNGRYAILAELPHKNFIKAIINGEWLLRTRDFMDKLNRDEQERQNQNAKQLMNYMRRKESQYILERGQWKRRRRF